MFQWMQKDGTEWKNKNLFNVKEIIETHRTPKTPKQYDTLFEKKKHLHKHFVAVTTTITPITNIKEAKKKINLLSTWSIRMTGKKSAEKCVHMKGMTYKKDEQNIQTKIAHLWLYVN